MSRRKRRRGSASPKNSTNRQCSGKQSSDSTSPDSPEDSQPENIADIPALKRDVTAVLNGAETIKAVVQLLKDEGVDHKVLDELSLGTEEILQYGNIGELADEFNATFIKYGWIATESLSTKVLQRALGWHEKGGIRYSEPVIMGWFGEETLNRYAVERYESFGKARARTRQLREALRLTMEHSYVSAVPLLLIACEGFSRDFLGRNVFETGVALTLEDSFVGHMTALPKFILQFTEQVSKTSADATKDPSRHGILHGRLLNYANPSVCKKAWLLFIALTDLYMEEEEQKKAGSKSIETLPEPTMEAFVKNFFEEGRKRMRSSPQDLKQMYAEALARANVRSR